MTAPNAIRKSDLERAAALVQKTGLAVEIEKNGLKIRVMPAIHEMHRANDVPLGQDVRL